MRTRLVTAVFAAWMVLPLALWAAPRSSYVGTVTDTKCGLHHPPGMNAAACTNACVRGGAHYALAIGTHVYRLDGHAKQLHRLAGDRVIVTGTMEHGQIQVASVRAAH